MMKTKQTNKKYVLLILLILFAGSSLLIKNGNRVIYGISSGIYRMVTDADNRQVPYIHFEMTGEEIRFTLSAENSSFSYFGTVKLDGRVRAVPENGEGEWIFEVVDNDTLVFCQKDSSELRLGDNNILPDGAVFKYADAR